MILHNLLVVGVAALVSYALTYNIRHVTQRWRIIDIPNERSSHSIPTPRGGGVAIVLITLLGVMYFAAQGHIPLVQAAVYLIAGAFTAIIGLLDDLRDMPSLLRLAAQGLVAVFVVMTVGFWTAVTLPLVGTIFIGLLGAAMVFLWVVGLVNAYNFMDGTDGMAGGVGLVISLGWILLSWAVFDESTAGFGQIIGLLLAGACLGFLGHNWSHARIFMGDVGSTFLGFSFAVLPLFAAQNPQAPVAGALLVWPFLFDTILTFTRRLLQGENIFAAHRTHLYQRLVIAGYSHRFVAVLYMAYTAIGVLMAWLWLTDAETASVLIVILIPCLCLAHYIFVTRREMLVAESRNGLTSS